MNAEEVTSTSECQFLQDGTVFGLFARQAARFADTDLFALPEDVRTLWNLDRTTFPYGETLATVVSLSDRFAAAGFGAGDRVALLLENRPTHFLHWLALNRLGTSVVPINPAATAQEIAYLLEHSGARLLIRLPGYAKHTDPVAEQAGTPIMAPGDTPPAVGRAEHGSADELARECALIYTSGTTGNPKGCMLSNRYFLNWATWYKAQGGLISLREGQERLLTPLPTFHVNAMGHSFMGMLSCGGTQIIVDRFHPSRWWRHAIETRATCFHYLGVMPAILMELPESPEERAHGMRFGLGGGVHPDHHQRFEDRFNVPLLEGWAMTETGGIGTLCAASEPRHVGTRCLGHPDRPGPEIETRLVDDEGQPVARGMQGELQLRARNTDPRLGFFSGYLKDPEATEAAWDGGWLHTGDVMRSDPDGSLHFVERRKNIIRRSGENIAAVEVEATILDVPGVSSVAVIPSPDPLREEEVMAVVVSAPGADHAALAEVIFSTCAERLAYFKVPGFVVFQESLPTTSTQKVRKPALRALAENPHSVGPDCVDFRDRKQALRKSGK